VNYIRHLNAFFARIKNEDSVKPFHISLYLALFQYWNFNRFRNPFPVYRENIMQLSKIGSKATYHKSIKLLHGKGYIIYHPAPSKCIPVTITVIRLDVKNSNTPFKQLNLFTKEGTQESEPSPLQSSHSHVPHLALAGPTNDTHQVPFPGHTIKQENIEINNVQHTHIKEEINHKEGTTTNKQVARVPYLAEVELFFQKENMPLPEAQKFYYYNQSKNWMISETPIRQWKALARKWILNTRNKPETIQPEQADMQQELQFIYDIFLQGQPVSKYIKPDFFEFLQLHLSEDHMKEAIRRRINQLSGSNEYTHSQLWQHYTSGLWNSEIIERDRDNLINLARRLAVLNYFEQLKLEGQAIITILKH
jgi:hypothetical protein